MLKHSIFFLLSVSIFIGALGQTETEFLGRLIGHLNPRQAGTTTVQGAVYAADPFTILIESFTFEPPDNAGSAFFYIGPAVGFGAPAIDVNNDAAVALRTYTNERFVLELNHLITNFQVLYIWYRDTQTNVGDLTIPADLVPPTEMSLGELGLTPRQHAIFAADVVIVNPKQLRLESFSYDDTAPDVYFWVGTGAPSAAGLRVADENGVIDRPISQYMSQTITLTLPEGVSVFDIDYFSVWCETFRVDFGNVPVPMTLDAMSLPAFLSLRKVLDSCEVLEDDKFQVAWGVDAQRRIICIELRGKVEPNEYLSFGISGSETGTEMIGSDVTVVWIDEATNQPRVVDYFLGDRASCSPATGLGACPDIDSGGDESTTLIDSRVMNGVTYISFEKPLIALLPTDLDIPTDRDVFISWAYGRIGATGFVTYHDTRTPGNLQLNFGRASGTCPDFTGGTGVITPVVPWVIPPITATSAATFEALIGPSGGDRGVTGITGIVGWGIAWYINKRLITEITVQRGVTYTFQVNGGDDPTMQANYHPFYITSSPSGGYSQLSPAEQQLETIYAGPVSGSLCQWTTTADPADHPTFATYQATLSTACTGQAGTLMWRPENNTPDLVYYQCYTHQYLGWRINVIGQAQPALPCDLQPCFNGGNCINFALQAFCICLPGFTGQRCQTGVNQQLPCDSLPCNNGGTCTNAGTTFSCTCTAGFTGATCLQVAVSPCDNSPCANGGVCTVLGPTIFQCTCQPGFTGNTCTVPVAVSPCDNSPCANGGVCTALGATIFQCTCQPGFTGGTCTVLVAVSPCDNSPCANGGVCTALGATNFQCTCQPGFTGNTCTGIQLPCSSQPCFNGGTCLNNGNNFLCQCAQGFTGLQCIGIQLPCSSQPCFNGGTCLNNGNNFLCQCAQGFTGLRCLAPVAVSPCDNSPCANGGVCTALGATIFQCTCQPGFTGSTCADQVTTFLPCDFVTCLNGAACVNLGPTTFQCNCPQGFTGAQCQTPVAVSPCDNSPCANGGVCTVLGPTIFQCTCQPGFTGSTCAVSSFQPCNSRPCFNGGSCVNFGQTAFFCNCLQGFTGQQCQMSSFQPCNSRPCFNGGSCVNFGQRAFICNCLTGFTGQQCQNTVTVTPCDVSTCANGGTCTVRGPNTFECTCQPGFTGTRCTGTALPCDSFPCLNGGLCRNRVSPLSFQCICPDEFTGIFCETRRPIVIPPPCDLRPCQNGGICENVEMGGTTTFLCTCMSGFTGTTCADTVRPCDSFPCENGGTCINDNNAPGDFVCFCTPQFQGIFCELRMCNPNPCLNGALLCTPDAAGFPLCTCANPFIGDTCQFVATGSCIIFPCLNGGICNNLPGGSFQCDCSRTDYTGQLCNIPLSTPCDSNPCFNEGICSNTASNQGFVCNCQQPYFGVVCQRLTLACDSSPCMNDGVCRETFRPVGYSCSCPPNFIGDRCQEPACNPNPCLNGATCFTFTNVPFFCVCSDGFSGINCQIGEGVCGTRPCLNSGVCELDSSVTRGYRCDCSNTGFSGANCVISNFCTTNNPCMNGGRCIFDIDAISCDCSGTGFTGTVCTIPVDSIPPIVSCIDDVRATVEQGAGGGIVNFAEPVASDNSGTVSLQSANRLPGQFYATGTTQVTYVFVDPSGNTARCVFNVIVIEAQGTAFTVQCPADICMAPPPGNTGNNFFRVSWQPPVVDGGMEPVVQLSGPIFPSVFVQNNAALSYRYEFIDARNEVAQCSFTARVSSDCGSVPAPPQILNCPSDITDTVSGPGATVFIDWPDLQVTGDNVLQISGPDASEGDYSVGARQVTYVFRDQQNRLEICSFTISVTQVTVDLIPPDCQPLDVRVTAPFGSPGLSVTFDTPTATDNSGSVSLISSTHTSGQVFGIGKTMVTFIFADPSGNTVECEFCVEVIETGQTPAPLIENCPRGITETVASPFESARVSWPDLRVTGDGITEVAGPQANGGLYPIGTAFIEYIFVDSINRAVSCSFTITITLEAPPPVIENCPGDITERADPVVRSTFVRWDNLIVTGQNVNQIGGPLISGDLFNVGTHPILYTFQDSLGRRVSCSFIVMVIADAPPPVIENCPGDITERADPVVRSTFVRWDNLIVTGQNVNQIGGPLISGDLFNVGTHPILYTFQDSLGRRVSCSFIVMVIADAPPPVIENCPGDITERADPVVRSTFVRWDNLIVTGQNVNQIGGPLISGDLFNVGTHPILYTFQDSLGRRVSCSFIVMVIAEVPPPVIENCPGDITERADPVVRSTFVRWNNLIVTGQNVNQIGGPLISGDLFNVGTHPILYVFEDSLGRRVSCSFIVMVIADDPTNLFVGCPNDIPRSVLVGRGGGIVLWTPPTPRDNSVRLINTPPVPGSFFQTGSTSVTYVFFEPNGVVQQCVFTISVEEVTPCDVGVCQNGGVCIPLSVTDFTCACPGCYRGDRCQEVVDPCTGNLCRNGGTCQAYAGSCEQYFCQCPPCFAGRLCETDKNACATSSCANGAVCVPAGPGCDGYTCECPGGFIGPNCDQGQSPCANNPCQNDGFCEPVGGSAVAFTCECQGCYTGFNCETFFNPCTQEASCSTGFCLNLPDSCAAYECICNDPCITGFQCEIALDPCANNPCQNGGLCVPDSVSCNAFTCQCQGCYTGVRCELPVDNPCAGNPCENDGVCEPDPSRCNAYTCQCQGCFTGFNCETFFNPCSRGGNPCKNNGFCLNQPESCTAFSCICIGCFTGLQCQMEINPCNDQPCRNGGTCVAGTESCYDFQCLCTPGFGGLTCMSDGPQVVTRNQCSSMPCANGGMCVPNGEGYHCLCRLGYRGTNCGLTLDGVTLLTSCFPGICQNGGTCYDSFTSSQPLQDTTFQYTCLCPLGFTGQGCVLRTATLPDFDECLSQLADYCGPNGACRNAYASVLRTQLAVCDCNPGYCGPFCGTAVGNPCTPNPCRNSGQCVVQLGVYFVCECQQGFSGETCEVLEDDRTPPTIMNCPDGPIIVRTREPQAAVDFVEPTAVDDSPFPALLVSANTAAGAVYTVGTSFLASYVFDDISGNRAVCTFFIQVVVGN